MKDDDIKLMDHFALEAMKVLLADQSLREADDRFWEEVARDAYGYAFAMVKERKKRLAELAPKDTEPVTLHESLSEEPMGRRAR